MRSTSGRNGEVELTVTAHELRILRAGLIETMEAIADHHNFRVRVGADRSDCQHLLNEIILAQRLLRGTPAGDEEGYSTGLPRTDPEELEDRTDRRKP